MLERSLCQKFFLFFFRAFYCSEIKMKLLNLSRKMYKMYKTVFIAVSIAKTLKFVFNDSATLCTAVHSVLCIKAIKKMFLSLSLPTFHASLVNIVEQMFFFLAM
jgi:hypothetical protein